MYARYFKYVTGNPESRSSDGQSSRLPSGTDETGYIDYEQLAHVSQIRVCHSKTVATSTTRVVVR